MEQPRIVAEADKGGRTNARLRHIINFQTAALVRRRLYARNRLRQQRIELPRRNAAAVLFIDHVDQVKQLGHALTGQRRQEHHGGIRHIRQTLAHAARVLLHRLAVLFHKVPFVDGDDAGLSGLMRTACDLGILLRDALRGINHNHTDIRPLNRHQRAHDAEFFHLFVHARAFANTRRIDQQIASLVAFIHAVHAVARCARDIADNDALFAENLVDERGLADIRLADDRDLDLLALRLVLRLFRREIFIAGIEQIAGAVAVQGGNGERVAQSEVVKFIKFRRLAARPVAFVDREHHRLARTAQHRRDILVRRCHAGVQVGDEHDDIGRLNGNFRLHAHKFQNFIVRSRLDTAGIHDLKGPSAPFGIGIQPVPRDARRILYNGKALARQPVEQLGFADIRSSDNRHNRLRHKLCSFLFTDPVFFPHPRQLLSPSGFHPASGSPSARRARRAVSGPLRTLLHKLSHFLAKSSRDAPEKSGRRSQNRIPAERQKNREGCRSRLLYFFVNFWGAPKLLGYLQDLTTVVIAASLANLMRELHLTALRALDQTRNRKLPDIVAPCITSRFRSLSLWYCHFGNTSSVYPESLFLMNPLPQPS